MLYQHQRDGAAWLAARSRGYLGDSPGLGKTRTLLAALSGNGVLSDTLIVCPAIVRTHWLREAAGLGYNGTAAGAPIVKSYDEIVRGGLSLMKHLFLKENIKALVLDEAHYLKHAGAQRTKILLGKDGYARRLPRVYAASGTPIPKNPSEFWTTLSSLFPDVAVEFKLRTFRDFVDRYCSSYIQWVRGEPRERFRPSVENEQEFREILSRVMLRRTLDDVGLDVPELDWQTTRLDGEVFDTYEDGLEVRHALDKGYALDEIANDPHVARMRRRLGELKIAPVATLLHAQLSESDEKVVVFAHHRTVLEKLRQDVAGRNLGVAYIDGDTSQSARDSAIDRFQTDPNCRVFIGQNIACQTGITLTAARRCFLVEPDWTAVVNQQLGHRIARIGQTAQHCIAHMVCLAGTLDEAIVTQNHREVRMADAIGLGEK